MGNSISYHTAPTLTQDEAEKWYAFWRKTNLFFVGQNSWTQPTARKYVERLFQEKPQAKTAVEGKLAIVTGVTKGGTGYHMAEELALSANMAVILMGRSPAKLAAAEEAIQAEAKKRGLPKPTLYHEKYDLDDLESVVSAAEGATRIAQQKGFSGHVHVLINNAGINVTTYTLTKQKVEANIGRNFLAPHLLTTKLMPLLKAAAVPGEYKSRCVNVASTGYSLSMDLNPDSLVATPRLGGAPEGFWKFQGDVCKNGLMDLSLMYGRAKLGDVATAHHLAKVEPSVNFTSMQPGSIVSNFAANVGLGGYIFYYGFYPWQLSASQGSVASLRAALDPDFNSAPGLQGAYLHSDGNPWPFDALNIQDPETKSTYNWDKYTQKVHEAADQTIRKVMGW